MHKKQATSSRHQIQNQITYFQGPQKMKVFKMYMYSHKIQNVAMFLGPIFKYSHLLLLLLLFGLVFVFLGFVFVSLVLGIESRPLVHYPSLLYHWHPSLAPSLVFRYLSMKYPAPSSQCIDLSVQNTHGRIKLLTLYGKKGSKEIGLKSLDTEQQLLPFIQQLLLLGNCNMYYL